MQKKNIWDENNNRFKCARNVLEAKQKNTIINRDMVSRYLALNADVRNANEKNGEG